MRRRSPFLLVLLVLFLTGGAYAMSPVYPPPPAPARLLHAGEIRDNSGFNRPTNWFRKMLLRIAGEAAPSKFARPHGLDIRNDILLVVDADAGLVHRFSLPDSTWSIIPSDGRLRGPTDGVSCPGGLIFVSDAASAEVIAFDSAGERIFSCEGPFQRPSGLAYDPSRNRLLVADSAAHQIVLIGLDGRRMGLIGRRGSAPGEFNYPIDVCVTGDDSIHVLDALNYRIQTLGPDGEALGQFGCQGDSPGCFTRPRGLAVTDAGLFFVTDALQDLFQIFDREGRLLLAVGRQGHGPGEFWMPAGISVDEHERVFVTDAYNHRVQIFQGMALSEGGRP